MPPDVTRGPLTHPHRLGPVQHMVVTMRHARCSCDDAGLPCISRSCPTSSPIRGMVCTTAQLWQLPPVLAPAPHRLPTRVTPVPHLVAPRHYSTSSVVQFAAWM